MRSWIWLLAVSAMLSTQVCANATGQLRGAAGINLSGAQKSATIPNFARSKPPRAYTGQNPSQAARAQDRR